MLRKNENNAWTDITQLRRHDGSAWVDCNFARKYENGAWTDVWTSEVQVGETVSFVSTPVPYNVGIGENSTRVVGYFSKPLTPGIYQVWAEEAHWYHCSSTDGIIFELYQVDVGRAYASKYNYKSFRNMNFGSVRTSGQDSGGDNWASISSGQPYVKVTGTGIVQMRGGPFSGVLEANRWGYPTLKVTNATIKRIS